MKKLLFLLLISGPAVFAQLPEKQNGDSPGSIQSLQRQMEQLQKEIAKRFPMLRNGLRNDSLGGENMEPDSSLFQSFGNMRPDTGMFKSFSYLFDGQNWKQFGPDSLRENGGMPDFGGGFNMQMFDPAKLEQMMRQFSQSMTPFMPAFPSEENDPAAKPLKEKSKKKPNKKYETEKI